MGHFIRLLLYPEEPFSPFFTTVTFVVVILILFPYQFCPKGIIPSHEHVLGGPLTPQAADRQQSNSMQKVQ